MAEKIVSPGVFTKEIDQSFLPAAIADIGAAVIGPTVKGPAGIPTIVESYSDFQIKFGDTFKSGSSYFQYLTSHTAREYFKNGGPRLTVVRVLAGSPSQASVTVSSSIDPVIVGGGTKATGSIDFGLHFVSSSTGTSASIGGVDFVFTASAAEAAATANTSTKIFVQPTKTAEFIVLDFTIQPTGATFPE